MKSYETFNASDIAAVPVILNEIKEFCSEIKVLTVIPAMTQLQQQVIVLLLELTFATSEDKSNFDLKFKKTKSNGLHKP